MSPKATAMVMLLVRSEAWTDATDTEEMLRVLVAYERAFRSLHPIERMQAEMVLKQINDEYRATHEYPTSTWFD